MTVKKLIDELMNYDDEREVVIREESTGTQRTEGEKYTIKLEEGKVVILVDIEGT